MISDTKRKLHQITLVNLPRNSNSMLYGDKEKAEHEKTHFGIELHKKNL